MDFLTNAFFSTDSEATEKLCGVLLTRFDAADITARAVQKYLTVEELRASNDLKPAGFVLDDHGVLHSDVPARRVLDQEMSAYLMAELKGEHVDREKSLIDFVLLGAECGALAAHPSDTTCSSPVSFGNLRVSNSSFNIYGAVQLENGSFKTLSLVDIDAVKSAPILVAIPENCIDRFSAFEKWMLPSSTQLDEYGVFEVCVPLMGYGAFTGEGFCNYLAYSVSYYTVGLGTIKSYLGDNAPQYKVVSPVAPPERKYRDAAPNLSIVAPYKTPKWKQILNAMEDPQLMDALISSDTEAAMTLSWLQAVVQLQNNDGEDVSQLCLNLQLDCKLQRLHCACELLAQRIYLHGLGVFDDTLGPVLKGGGVSGYSFKKFTR